jgi:hypothetical protein
MKPEKARFIANTIVFAAGGALAILAWRQPAVRKLAVRALPLILGGASPLQAAAFALSQAAIAGGVVAASARARSPQRGQAVQAER